MITPSKVVSSRTCNTKSNNVLIFHPKKKLAVHKLPFVGRNFHDTKHISYWDVPAEGGYFGGNITGGAIVGIYLNYLRDNREEAIRSFGYLGWIVMHWMEQISKHDPKSVEHTTA